MDAILSQKTMPWGNELLGTSKYYIHAYGCFITVLAEILGVTPLEVNTKLNAVSGFAPDKDGQVDEVIWEKVGEAFPGWNASYVTPYNNDAVLAALAAGDSVIVQVDAAPIGNPGGLHAVRFMGNGVCHDPWDGTAKPTSTYPMVKAYNVLHQVPVTEIGAEPVVEDKTYKGLDLTNEESVKAAIDTWKDVVDGVYIRADSVTAATLHNVPTNEKQTILEKLTAVNEEVKILLGLS